MTAFPSSRDQTALEAALLRELAAAWAELAHNHFRGALKPPVMTLVSGVHRLGAWHRLPRTIALSRELVFAQSWGVVREVLKHEIAHQYVDEVLGIHDETAHGPAFVGICAALGIDSRGAGLPVAGDGAGAAVNPVLRRIMRLLALAESPNLHEAEAAMNEARRLMLLHNVDAAAAAHDDGYGFRHVGAVKARSEMGEKILAGILTRHFFVSAIWVPSYLPLEQRRGYVLELCGTPANLEVAVYVHGFLMETAERLWRAHKRAAGIDRDRERRRFIAGVMTGFDEKLRAGEKQSQREGLVCHADAQREAYLRKRYPRRSTRGGGSILMTPAYEHGRQAGRAIELRRGVQTDGAATKMLPPVQR